MPANPTTTAVLELNAVDNTTAVIKKVATATDGLRSSYEKLQGVLGSLGVGLSIGYFAAVMKGSIDAMDHLNDLAKTANLTVEAMSGLGIAAKQSGGDLDSIAQSLNKLSVNMGKDAEKFAKLGVTAKDPLEAFKQLSDVFVAIQDPQLRAAVGAEALGKSWAGAAPLLLEGGKRIGEMVEAGTRAAGVTGDMARQADEFNDKLGKLVGTGRGAVQMIGPLLPMMNMLADDMLRARDGAKGFNDGISPLLEVMKVLLVLGSDVSFVFTQMGKDIARAFENVRLIAKGDWAGSRALGEMFKQEGLDARKALDEWQKRVIGVGTKGAAGESAAADPAAAAAAAARGKAFVGGGGSVEDTDAAYRGLLKTLKEKLLVDGELNEVAKLQTALDALSAKNLATITPARERELKGLAREIDLRKQRNAQMDNDAKNEAALTKMREEGAQVEADAQVKRLAALNAGYDQAEQIEFETKLIGESNVVRETAIALRALETSGIRATDEAYAGLAQRMTDAIAGREAARQRDEFNKKSLDEFKSLWSTVEQTGKSVFVHVFSEGKTAFEGIGKAIKASIIDMLYQLTVRKWIIQIGASLAGSLGMSGAALAGDSMFGSAGGGGLGGMFNMGSAANTVSGWMGGPSVGPGSLSSFFSGGGAAAAGAMGAGALGSGLFAGGAATTFGTGIAAGSAMGAGALGGGLSLSAAGGAGAMGAGALGSGIAASGGGALAGGAAAGLAAIPVWGWAALAAMAILSMSGDSGPKPSELGILGSPGQFWVSQQNVPGGEANLPLYNTLNAQLNDPTKYDQSILAQHIGYMQGQPGEDANSMFQKLLSALEPAAAAAQATAAVKAQDDAAAAKALSDAAEKQLEAARQLESLSQRDTQLTSQLAGAVRGLADQLGIGTLKSAIGSLGVSEYLSPMDRLAGARSQFDTTLAGARGGDLAAVSALPEAVQTLLGIGRDVYASGGGFQDLFREANLALGEVLARQQGLQDDILKDVPVTIMEASRDQIAELRRGFTAMTEELSGVRDELRQLRAAA